MERMPRKLPEMPHTSAAAWFANQSDSPCCNAYTIMETAQEIRVNRAKRPQGMGPEKFRASPTARNSPERMTSRNASTSAPQLSFAA